MTAPVYEFLVRDPRTLAVLGELRPQDLGRAQWTRLQYEPGAWSLTVPRVSAVASSAAAGTDLIAVQNLVEVRRDGEREYCGYILARSLDPLGEVWTLEGFDLKDWLQRRVCAAETAEPASGVAETVLKTFVDDHLGVSAAAGRQATGELTGKTFTVEADQARGGSVEYQAQRRTLAEVTADICRQGSLLQDVVLVEDGGAVSGIEYRVSEPVDATEATGAVPFAVGFDNVEGLGYREDFRRVQNALYCAGAGTGDSRPVRSVADAASCAAQFRREGVYDARYASTADQLDAIGLAEVARQVEAAVSADVVPLTTSANARYRQDWDVGWDVTVAIPAAGVAAINRRVASATVSITPAAGERISMSLGNERANSMLRQVEQAIRRLQVASNG